MARDRLIKSTIDQSSAWLTRLSEKWNLLRILISRILGNNRGRGRFPCCLRILPGVGAEKRGYRRSARIPARASSNKGPFVKRQARFNSPRDRLFFFGAAAERNRARECGP